MKLVSSIVSAYIPTLTALVQQSSQHRQAAARLVAQCFFLKTILSMHLEGLSKAMYYAKEAVTYSQESTDIPLGITALGRLAWVYSCAKQQKRALEQALEAKNILNSARNELPFSVRSYVHGVVAKYQALNGQRDPALESLQRAHETFFAAYDDKSDHGYTYMDHDLSNFLLDDGVTHIFIAQYEDALSSFANIIRPDDLLSQIPVAERIRVEVLNYQTLASLKSPKKDLDQTLQFWQAGIEGARHLQSEQRFSEACITYEMLECVWSGEERIANMRELTIHW